MEIYTDVMKEIMSKRIDKYADMSGHTVDRAIKKTNSDGGIWLIIIFTDGYWTMIEPVRYDNNDVTFHIIDDDHWRDYNMYLMSMVGICSKDVYDVEKDWQMKAYYDNIVKHERKHLVELMDKYPELVQEKLS